MSTAQARPSMFQAMSETIVNLFGTVNRVAKATDAMAGTAENLALTAEDLSQTNRELVGLESKGKKAKKLEWLAETYPDLEINI